MTSRLRPFFRIARISYLRTQQALGVHGLIGLALLCAAGSWLSAEHARHRSMVDDMQGELSSMVRTPYPGTSSREQVALPRLPNRSDVPRILARIERASVTAGLGWPRADYEIKQATDEGLASLEVRGLVRGSYPQLRSLVTNLLQDNPTLTLKELSFARASADKAEVDSKFVLVVYLADEKLPALRAGR